MAIHIIIIILIIVSLARQANASLLQLCIMDCKFCLAWVAILSIQKARYGKHSVTSQVHKDLLSLTNSAMFMHTRAPFFIPVSTRYSSMAEGIVFFLPVKDSCWVYTVTRWATCLTQETLRVDIGTHCKLHTSSTQLSTPWRIGKGWKRHWRWHLQLWVGRRRPAYA